MKLECEYRIDVLVEDKLLPELKSVENILPIHVVQILTYMKISKIKAGLLINLNVKRLKEWLKRFVL